MATRFEPKRILVCLDDSPHAPGVLAAAVELAQRTEASLSLLRAVPLPRELRKIASVELGADVIELLQRRAERELGELAEGVPAESLEGIHVHVGTPSATICREARELDAEVVVIGSQGRGATDRIVGRTAADVVNHCDRSVLVVRRRPLAA